MKTNYFKICLLLLGFSSPVTAQTLNPGDVVIIGYAADTGLATSIDEFSWVPLVDLPENTKLYFTDAGYNTIDADFMGTGINDEILIRYIVPAGGITAGTVFTVTEENIPPNYTVISGTKFGNDFNSLLTFPNAGDQITVFQSTDDENTPSTFGDSDFTALFMVTGSSLSFTALNTNTAGITPASSIDNFTNLAPGLTNAVNAVAVGTGPLEGDESDNARYTGIITGTRDEILFAVSQLANWTRYDEAFGNDIPVNSTANGWTRNGVDQFTITPLSIAENNYTDITIFPNPSKGVFNISGAVGNVFKGITLSNHLGQILKTFEAVDAINISDLPNGCYLLTMISERSKITKKIIKY